MLAWRAVLSLNGSECQAAGIHLHEHERWIMADLSVSGEHPPTVCSLRTSLNTGSGITAISAGVMRNLKIACPQMLLYA